MKMFGICLTFWLMLVVNIWSQDQRPKVVKSWTPIAPKEPVEFPIIKIGKKSRWSLQVRSSETENFVKVYKFDTAWVAGVRQIRSTSTNYDINGGILPLRRVLASVGLDRFPSLDSGLVTIQTVRTDEGYTAHWLLIEGANSFIYLSPVWKRTKYISCEIRLLNLNEPISLKGAIVQEMGDAVLFMKGSELRILSADGQEVAADKIGEPYTIMNSKVLPIKVGRDSTWIVWVDGKPRHFGRLAQKLFVSDSARAGADSILAAQIYFDGQYLRSLWSDGSYSAYNLDKVKHQVDYNQTSIGKAKVLNVSDFGRTKAVVWYDQKNKLITGPADSIYAFPKSQARLYSARCEGLLGLVDTIGTFHELPISGYGELRDARLTDLFSLANESKDDLTQLDIEESEDLAVVQYETEEGLLDSAYVWPKKAKLTPYWGKPIYARDSLYLFKTTKFDGAMEILRPADDFSETKTRYYVNDWTVNDSNIHESESMVIGKQRLVKLGFRRRDSVKTFNKGFDWLWTGSGRITWDLGTFVGYAELKGYSDSSIYVFVSYGKLTLVSADRQRWWVKPFYIDDLPIGRASELVVTVWNSVGQKNSLGVETVYARIVLENRDPNKPYVYDKTVVLPIDTRISNK